MTTYRCNILRSIDEVSHFRSVPSLNHLRLAKQHLIYYCPLVSQKYNIRTGSICTSRGRNYMYYLHISGSLNIILKENRDAYKVYDRKQYAQYNYILAYGLLCQKKLKQSYLPILDAVKTRLQPLYLLRHLAKFFQVIIGFGCYIK